MFPAAFLLKKLADFIMGFAATDILVEAIQNDQCGGRDSPFFRNSDGVCLHV